MTEGREGAQPIAVGVVDGGGKRWGGCGGGGQGLSWVRD